LYLQSLPDSGVLEIDADLSPWALMSVRQAA
jgi:hypothetical protein